MSASPLQQPAMGAPLSQRAAQGEAAAVDFAAGLEEEFQSGLLASGDRWEHADLFDQLATCMHRQQYDWTTLIQVGAIIIGEKDRSSAAATALPTPIVGASASKRARPAGTTAAASDRLALPIVEGQADAESAGDDDEEEEDNLDDSTDAGPPASSDAINPDDLGAHQTKAIRYLQVAIIRHLSANPPAAVLHPSVDSFSLSPSASSPSAHATTSPIVLPKDGDVIGVWLVALLCAAKNRSGALAILKAIEILGRVAQIRITTQKCFLLLQRDRVDEDGGVPNADAPPASSSSVDGQDDSIRSPLSGSSDLSKLVSPHLASGFVTPSSFLPLPAISAGVVNRFRLTAQLLRTLQVMVGDGVLLPAIATLTASSVASPSSPPLTAGPSIFYSFTDTPLFPRISGGATPSAQGYCWTAWVCVKEIQDGNAKGSASGKESPLQGQGGSVGAHAHNIFRFFNDVGHGVQVYLRANTLCVRVLPHAADPVPLKNFVLHAHRWYFLTIVHKPKPMAKPTTAAPPVPPITSNMANVTSFAAAKPNTTPAASYRPTATGASQLHQQGSSHHLVGSPTSPTSVARQAQLFLYVDGRLVSSNDVPYPVIENSESMQVSLGGYTGCMGPFHFFHDTLSPSAIYSLWTLGAGAYAAPAHHIVNTGLVTVFPPSPSATSLNITDAPAASSSSAAPTATTKSDHGATGAGSPPLTIINHRIVARVLLSHSPSQTTHEFCLPYAWADDWNIDHFHARPLVAPAGGMEPAGSGCANHTLRLPGVGVQQRRNNSQWFVDIGGLKLLLQSLSPLYAGPHSSIHQTDEEVAEMLTLVALAAQANPHSANQLLEIGAATFKQLLLDHLKKRHKTAVLINGLKHFLLVVEAIDHTPEQVHFASFVSYLLLDLTYWRACSTHIQSLVIHLLKLLVLHNPRPFIAHPVIGVARIIDSVRVLTHRFFSPESQINLGGSGHYSTAPTPSVLSPTNHHDELAAAAAAGGARRDSHTMLPSSSSFDEQTTLQINIDQPSPTHGGTQAYSPTAAGVGVTSPTHSALSSSLSLPSSSEPTESEMDLVRTLLSIATEIASQSVASAHFEAHILQPFLHLLQLSTVSASNFPPTLVIDFLQTFLRIVPISSHRTLTWLHGQNAVHVFVKLLFGDSVAVRTLALKCLEHMNYHLVRLGKLDRGKTGATNESMYLQSDMATAIGSCLSLHTPISAGEHDALFELLMGQVPVDQTTEGGSKGSPDLLMDLTGSPNATPRKMHRGMSLETGLAFCHSAYLSVILELALSSSLPIQSKILLDLLTLLRSNPHNVLIMASLFWQKLLLPFLSKMTPPASQKKSTAPEEGDQPAPSLASPGSSAAAQAADRDTIDVLVYQLLNLLLIHCMTNEPKGWQVLDQVLWCLDEAQRVRMMAAIAGAHHHHPPTEGDSGTVTDQWIVQVAIFNRLFQFLQKNVMYLSLPAPLPSSSSGRGSVSSSGSFDSPGSLSSSSNSAFSLHSEGQISNLRRNIPAVFELTEWLLFHSKDSFLTRQEKSGRRTSSVGGGTVGDRDGDDGVLVRKESIPKDLDPTGAAPAVGGSSAADASEAGSMYSDAHAPNVNHGEMPPMASRRTGSMAFLPAVSRASLRSSEEPLTEAEVEVLAGLLTGVVKNYPLPERRQDVLRIMFRYLMTVLPHPLCASLCPLICDCILHLFTERIPEINDKNNRLIALSLYLLKQSMELFMRRDDKVATEQIKVVIASIFARVGPAVFQASEPTQQAATAPTPGPSKSIMQRGSIVAPRTPGSIRGGEVDLMTGSPIAASPASADALATASPAAPSKPPPEESALEQALYHLYSGEGKSLVDSTQQVFEQHELRLGYVVEGRARQVAESVQAYLRKQMLVDNRREKTFSLQSMEVQKRVQRERPFLLGVFQVKKGSSKIAFRKLPRDVKHGMKIHKLLKHYHYQHANSRPRAGLPALLSNNILEVLQARNDAFSPYVRSSDLTPAKLNYSSQLEFWKLDSTESPTRMRRIVKKNFRGSAHLAASQNAATGKTAIMAPQALDLAESLKNIVKLADTNTGVDADAVITEAPTPTSSSTASSGRSTPVPPSAKSSASSLEQNEGDEDNDSGDDDDEDDGGDGEEDEEAASGGGKKRSKYLLTRDCVMITAERKYLGAIKIAQQHLVFAGTEIFKLDLPAGSHGSTDAASVAALKLSKRKPKEKFLRWPLKHIRMVLPRLYLLRESALEIFLNNFKNHFFNFTPVDEETSAMRWDSDTQSKKMPTSTTTAAPGTAGGATGKKPIQDKKVRSGNSQRNEVYKLLCSLCQDMQFELSPGRRLLKSGIMKKWQRGEISNFDYLQHLNSCAGRSYNDLNQYPVFPWVLTDYKSPTLDLSDPSIYRDFSKPIGALNEDRFEIYNERFMNFEEDESMVPFMYGSHYSSAGITLYYLLRLEPFTHLAINLQGNHFDLADRLFDSISGAWELSLNNVGDVKELIPEFYYLPDFLRNVNGLDLGTKQDKQKLGDVVLPPWAKGSPEEFVRIMRAALESDYVSSHLHEWIDLIFGFKQKGKAAVDASNVFFYLTYAGAVDIDAIENPALRLATLDQIQFFGQTPAQLLTSPHPQRFSPNDRAKLAAGIISLPAKLNPTFSSQQIYYYQSNQIRAKERERRATQVRTKLAGSKTLAPPGGAPASLLEDPFPPSSSSTTNLHPEQSHGHTFDADRASIVSQVPTSLCFGAGNIVIAVTSDLTLQTHNLSSFLQQPPTLVSALPQQDLDAYEAEAHQTRTMDSEASRTASASTASGSGGASTTLAGVDESKEDEEDRAEREEEEDSSMSVLDHSTAGAPSETDLLAPKPDPSATVALTNAGHLLVSTLTSAPGFVRKQLVNMIPAQRIPPTVQSSHIVQPMCQHWFLDPARRTNDKEKVALEGDWPHQEPAASSGDSLGVPKSPSATGAPSPSLFPRLHSSHPGLTLASSSFTLHPCITALAQNGQFLFTGGYFDGSLKCHSILHWRAEDVHSTDTLKDVGAVTGGVASPRHTRSPTSPAILTSTALSGTSNAVSANRAAIQTRKTADCKPLSTVQAHHAPITAMCLAHNQSILFTGDAHGSLLVWRVFTERHERNRPPLSSAPLANFPVHEGRVLSIASNTYIGIAVSLAMDMENTRGCELCVYSVRGGTAKFIRSQLATEPDTCWEQVVLTSSANIVVSGSQAGVPMLFLYSLSGHLVRAVPTEEVINVLYATPATAKTTAYEGFIVTGGRKSVVVFRSPHTLEPIQSFFCDNLFPQSIAHDLAPTGMSGPVRGGREGAPPPVAMPAKDLWDGSSSAADAGTETAEPTAAAPAAAPPVTEESQAVAAHVDPMLSALVKDSSLPIRMGVAAFDISPSQQHFVVSMYPPAFPPMPSGSDDPQPQSLEGRLLLFPLPHSSHDATQLGFYIDAGWQTLDTVRDALHARMTDTKEMARDKLSEARERWAHTQVQATEKLKQAKTKLTSMFTGLFGSSSPTPPTRKNPPLTLPSALPPR